MAQILKLHEQHPEDRPVLRETKCRVWWSLFMADRWCPPGLGLPRQINISENSLEFPMDEQTFQQLDATSHITYGRRDGLWKYNVTLVDLLGPIQDLNQALVRQNLRRGEIDEQVARFSNLLDNWHENLPDHMKMSSQNLEIHRSRRCGGTFVALHLGWHHYSTLLFFHYLDAASDVAQRPSPYVDRCRFHALSFSNLLRSAREKEGCEVVYFTVAHMTIISSSVLLHLLIFGDDAEVDAARSALSSNFEALVELKRYWPIVDTLIRRLLSFQSACLHVNNTRTYRVDKWMVRFLLEYGLPLGEKKLQDPNGKLPDIPSPDLPVPAQLFERASILSGFFSTLLSEI